MSDEKAYLKPIGARLKEVRIKLGFRNRDSFAEAYGVPKKTFEKYEQGLIELPTKLLLWLQEKHRINLTWLMTGNETMFDAMPIGAAEAHDYDIVLLQKIGDRVETIFIECKQRAPLRSTIAEAGQIYNELIKTIPDVRDEKMVQAVLPVLLERFKERIATAQPGSGKREAS